MKGLENAWLIIQDTVSLLKRHRQEIQRLLGLPVLGVMVFIALLSGLHLSPIAWLISVVFCVKMAVILHRILASADIEQNVWRTVQNEDIAYAKKFIMIALASWTAGLLLWFIPVLGWILAPFVTSWVAVRLSFALPAQALNHAMSLQESWVETAENQWLYVLVLAFFPWGLGVLKGLAEWLFPGLSMVFFIVIFGFELALLSCLYHQHRENKVDNL